jgi:hypothetical protein
MDTRFAYRVRIEPVSVDPMSRGATTTSEEAGRQAQRGYRIPAAPRKPPDTAEDPSLSVLRNFPS